MKKLSLLASIAIVTLGFAYPVAYHSPIPWAYATGVAALTLTAILPFLILQLGTAHGHVRPLLTQLWNLSFYLPIPQAYRISAYRMLNYQFLVGAVAVISHPSGQSTYFFLRHRYPLGKPGEYWGLPGGAAENEDIRETLRRELAQECRLAISVNKLLAVDVSAPPRIDFYFACTIEAGQSTPHDEIAEAGFLPLDALPESSFYSRHRDVLRFIEAGVPEKMPFYPPLREDDFTLDNPNSPYYHVIRSAFVDEVGKTNIERHISYPEPAPPIKLAEIVLSVGFDYPPDKNRAVAVCPTCNKQYTATAIDHRFGFGHDDRLEIVIPSTPALECDCGTFVRADAALAIKATAYSIRTYLHFRSPEGLEHVSPLFSGPQSLQTFQNYAERYWAASTLPFNPTEQEPTPLITP